jgi:aminoglycoside 3-N-acetyltransferase
MKGVVRSDHPQVSFAARGKKVSYIVDSHELEFGMVKDRPCQTIRPECSHTAYGCRSFEQQFIASGRIPGRLSSRKKCKDGAPIMENGRRVWKEFNDFDLDSDDFLS